jgi:tetratricopeptide (TPR) repeat protein
MIYSKPTKRNRAYLLYILIFIIFVSCATPIAQAGTIKTTYDWNKEGYSLFNDGRYSEALDAFNNSLSIDPKDAIVWYNKGLALSHLDRYSEALDAFNKSLSINPKDGDAWYEKGYALAHLGMYSDASDTQNIALSINSNNTNAWNNKGYALAHLGRYQDALDAYDKALSIDTNNTIAWNNKGYALDNLGRYQDALDAYDKALSIDTNNTIAQVNKNNLLTKMGPIQTTTPATNTTIVTQTITSSPTSSYSRSGDFNFLLSKIVIPIALFLAGGWYGIFTEPIIAILVLVFLVGGGYGIYRIKKKTSVDRTLVKERVSGQKTDAIYSRTEQTILNQITEIQNNPAVSSVTKSELNVIVNTIREINLAETGHPLKMYARKQLNSINIILNHLHQKGVSVDRSPDNIQQMIDNEKYEDAIVESDKLLVNLAYSEMVYDKATAYIPTTSDPDIVSLYNKGEYASVIKIYEERQAKIELVNKRRETVKQLHEAAERIGIVPDSIKKNLKSQNIETLERTIYDLNSFIADARPILTLMLDHTKLIADDWNSMKIQVTNQGNTPVQDVRLTFSGEFETKWIKPAQINARETVDLDIEIRQKLKGNIPLDVMIMYRDNLGMEYRETHGFWIDFV